MAKLLCAGEAGGFITLPPQLQAGFWPMFQMFHQTISLRSVICYLLEQIELRDITSQWLRKTKHWFSGWWLSEIFAAWLKFKPWGRAGVWADSAGTRCGSHSGLESSLPYSCGMCDGGRHWAAGSSWVAVTWHCTAGGHKPWAGYQGQSCDNPGQPPSHLGGFATFSCHSCLLLLLLLLFPKYYQLLLSWK